MEANVAPDRAVASGRGGRGLRILLVWGVRFTGECLVELLERDPLVSVVGLFADLSEAVALSAALQADIILLDARMPEGAAAVRRALDVAPGMRIVVSAVRETEDDIVTWAEAGVIGYIPRTTPLNLNPAVDLEPRQDLPPLQPWLAVQAGARRAGGSSCRPCR